LRRQLQAGETGTKDQNVLLHLPAEDVI
jgi:hypothetical protein